VNPKVVSERLGHHSVAFTLDTYAHVLPGMQAEAAQDFDDLVFGEPVGDTDDEQEQGPAEAAKQLAEHALGTPPEGPDKPARDDDEATGGQG